MLIHLCKQAAQRSAPREKVARGRGDMYVFGGLSGALDCGVLDVVCAPAGASAALRVLDLDGVRVAAAAVDDRA